MCVLLRNESRNKMDLLLEFLLKRNIYVVAAAVHLLWATSVKRLLYCSFHIHMLQCQRKGRAGRDLTWAQYLIKSKWTFLLSHPPPLSLCLPLFLAANKTFASSLQLLLTLPRKRARSHFWPAHVSRLRKSLVNCAGSLAGLPK